MIALENNGPGIGDKLQFAALPEIIFDNTGEKVLDLCDCWIYDHNPYVVRGSQKYSEKIDLWSVQFPAEKFLSTSEKFFKHKSFERLGFHNFKINLRHPRIYKFEDSEIKPDRITVHTTGQSEGGTLSDSTIDHIAQTYKNFEIIQIGGPQDKKTPFINKLGLNMWDTAKLISSSSILIGVNSGAGMWIANCYTRVNKKIVLNRNDMSTISPLNENTGWLDFNIQYFNQTENDIGTTFSYKKI